MFGLFKKNADDDINLSESQSDKDDKLHDKAILESLDKSQAIIEFSPDGTILKANQNFLSAVGYSLFDIEGKHHRIFCGEQYARSAEYNQLWQKLARGEYISGKFQRFKADGSEMWLEASYNPVFDSNGRVEKVIKFASDITADVQKATQDDGVLQALNRSTAVIEFDTSGTILNANDNFVSAVGYSLDQIKGKHHRIFCSKELSSSSEYQNFWQDLSRGVFKNGLYERVDASGNKMWLEATYNPIYDSDGKIVKIIKFASDVTERVKQDIAASEAVYSTSIKNEQVSKQAEEVLNNMVTLVGSIAGDIKTAASEVNELNTESEKITAIVDTILSIAEQTNLLALNAAIEAARAGEQGRGFAVVADEVRNLAKRTGDSITEITNVVQKNKSLANQVAASIGQTQAKTNESEEMIQQVSTVINEISQAVDQVVDAVEQRARI